MKEVIDIIISIMWGVVQIVGLLSLVWVTIVTALFYPVTRLRKHNLKLEESKEEQMKILVETNALERSRKETDKELKQKLYVIHQKELYEKELDARIAEKEKETKSEQKKRGPGRPPKKK